MEYTAISPNINIIINNNNNNSLSSSSQLKLISQSKQQQISHQQPPPDFINSIDELREFSTALSAFLHDFDDLRNHITSITSAIDAQLPPHLLLLLNTNDAAATTTERAIFAERNPNGTEKGNGELRHANNDELKKVVEERNDKLKGIDILVKKESDSFVSEEDVDIWKMIEDIDRDDDDVASKKKKRRKEPEKSDGLRKAEEIEKSKEEEREIEVAEKKKREKSDVLEDGEIEILEDGEIDMLEEEDREVDVLKKKAEEIKISKEDGEIDLEDGEIDMSKVTDEITISKKKRKKIIILKKKKKQPKEIGIPKKQHHTESDASKKQHEEIRISKRKHEEIDNLKKQKDEEIDISKKKHDETDALKRPAEIDVSTKPDTSDTLWRPEVEIDILTKPKERETSKENGEDDTFMRPAENDVSKKLVENDILNKPEEIDVPKEPQEETDASKKPAEFDLLNKPVEVDVSKKPVEIDVLNQYEEIDVSNKPEEIDVSNKPEEIDVSKKPKEIDVSNKPEEIDVSKKPEEIDVLNKSEEIDVSNKADEVVASKKPAIAMLELLCKEMRAKEMKEHVQEHISEMNSLHQEIAKALKLAINPAKLVLDSIGRLFLISKRAYYNRVSDHKQIVARQAAVLILECFVMISGDGIEITKEDTKYAENVAIDWRKRVIKEGGLVCMEVDDARGLLLFISGFGIPDGVFSNKDFRDLIRASYVKEISNALRHSTILIPKLLEVIDWMVKNNFEIEAADIAYTFGLENKCHNLQEETDALKKTVEVDVLNKPEEIDVLNKPEEVDVLNKPEEVDVLNKPEEVDVLNKPEEIDVSKMRDEIDVSNKPEEIGVSNKPEEIDVSNKADEIDASKKPTIAVLEFLCKEMCAKELKKHVLEHISEMNSLHQEIAKALKLAIDPAKLVLEAIGSFFLQTSRAYYYGESRHHEIAARQAAVLILECFVMVSSDGIEITKEDKEYAKNAAIGWRKRMIKEGGLKYMEADDARGLLLFISGFGIPDGVFSNEDFADLISASNVKEISNALCHSAILIRKLPEVIDWMVKNKLEIEAADIAYTFGLEDKCHPETILMTFLHNKILDTQNGSSLQVNAATMQQLSDLKSILKCLETHKIDPSKFLPGVDISEKIKQREKVMNELDLKSTEEKSILKRKEKETQFSKDLNHQQAKRICLSQENLPHKQNPHDHYGIRPYNGSTQPSRGYFDRNLPNNYVTTYSASSVFRAPVLPPNTTSSVPGGLAGSYGPYVYGGPRSEPMARPNNTWPYGWHGGQPYSRQSQAYGPPWQAPAVSFPGMPDHSLPGGFFGRPGSSSDLYRFADTVVERGSHRGPRGW